MDVKKHPRLFSTKYYQSGQTYKTHAPRKYRKNQATMAGNPNVGRETAAYVNMGKKNARQ